MSFIGKNIRKIRTIKKLSQAAYAELFNLARPSIGAYEEARAEPKIDTIIQMANYFGISVDALLTKELTINELYRLDIYHKEFDPTASRVPEPTSVSGIPLIEIQDYIEYSANLESKDYLQKRKQISIPGFDPKTHIGFELNGSEMEYNHHGLHHGDILICSKRSLKKLNSIEIGGVYVILTESQALARRVTSLKTNFILTADDPNYPKIEIAHDQVVQILEVKSVLSTYLNPPTMLEERLLRLEIEVDKLKKN